MYGCLQGLFTSTSRLGTIFLKNDSTSSKHTSHRENISEEISPLMTRMFATNTVILEEHLRQVKPLN